MEKHFDDETEPPAAQRSATEVIGEFVRVALFVFSIVACCVVLLGKTFLPEGSVLLYILSGSWQRGFNVFAATSSLLSACAVLIAVGIILAKCGVDTTALLTGGSITLNQDTRNETWAFGGVRIFLGATINLRGMPHIAGNAETNGEPSNLMLDEAINITGPILEGAEVGITANPGTYFTEYRSWDNYNPSKGSGTVFTPDDQLQMVKLTLVTEGGTVNASGFTQKNGAYTASITPGESIELPAPERSGYYFRGWYLDGMYYRNDLPVTKDLTLTANWEKIVLAPGQHYAMLIAYTGDEIGVLLTDKDGLLAPQASGSRAEAAKMLMSFLDA